MERNGTILIIDNDHEDLEYFNRALQSLELKNKIVLFDNAKSALEYLRTSKDFFILSDINMPKMNGFEFREEILKDDELFLKAVPFLFTSTAVNFNNVAKGYSKFI